MGIEPPQPGNGYAFLPSRNGLHYDNAWPDVPDLKITTPVGDIPIGSASNGLCGGMVFVVRDLFEAHQLPPASLRNPVPDSPAFRYIVRRLFDSFNLPSGVAQYYEWMNLPRHDTWLGPHGLSWRTINETMPVVRQTIDSGHPCPLGLVRVHSTDPMELGQNHQVLAWGYADEGANTIVRIYDPNEHDRDDITITFDHTHPEHTTDFMHSMGDLFLGFFPVDYSPADPAAVFLDGNVTFEQPPAGATVQGVAPIVLHGSSVTGVEISAYYATNPTDVHTVGWHVLGRASQVGGQVDRWAFQWDTRSVPDQGNAGWGTVNVAAGVLDGNGNNLGPPHTDYRRFDVKNNP
jgi:hypothetical protein